jgi:hypothetical protein
MISNSQWYLYIIICVFFFIFLTYFTFPSYGPRKLSPMMEHFVGSKSIEDCIPFQKQQKIQIPAITTYNHPSNPLSPSDLTPSTVLQKPCYVSTETVNIPSILPTMKPTDARLLQTKLLFDGIWEDIPNCSKTNPRKNNEVFQTLQVPATKQWNCISKNEIPIESIQTVKDFIKVPKKIVFDLNGLPDPNPCIDVAPDSFYVTVYHNRYDEEK